ncbi:MAG: TIGR03617 family F420-dependent LLM class oxidoreductase [Acidimicrobiia bacterium]
MLLDASFLGSATTAAADARALEDKGYAALWSADGPRSPFFPLVLAAPATTAVTLGTGITIAFPRSAFVLAQTAWELQELSGGRFVLGLGTQVRPHVERRFGSPFDHPGPRLRELVLAVRALWRAFRGEERLDFQGDFYRLDLLTPPFTPPTPRHPDPPLYLAAVNRWMFRMAGEVADGVFVHPFHSPRFLDEVAIPALEEGLARAGRNREALTLVSRVMVVATDDPDEHRAAVELARHRIAFYASTRAYLPVLAVHGWEQVGTRLSALAAARDWDAMPALVNDDMVAAFTVEGTWAELPGLLEARYRGRLDRMMIYDGFGPRDESVERRLVAAVNHARRAPAVAP